MPSVLEGIRILAWAAYHVGSVAGSMLGQLGAEVIKIEQRTSGDPARGVKKAQGVPADLGHGRNSHFEGFNRSTKSITLDLKKQAGREVVYRLVRNSDVFLTNFRSRAIVSCGMEYETLRRYNPRLIYAASTAYGKKGADRDNPGFDTTLQARSGIMMAQRKPDAEPFSPLGIADQIGSMCLAYGILAALLARARFGIGQRVDTSALNGLLWLQLSNVNCTLLSGQEFRPFDRKGVVNPLWNLYQAGDGKWISILMGVRGPTDWHLVCQALGMEELEKDPRFEDMDRREENSEELVSIMESCFATRPRAEWLRIAEKWDVICSPVQTVSEALSDPQVLQNDYVIEYEHPVLGRVKMLNYPVEFAETPAKVIYPAPELGQHTHEVLTEVGGYSWKELERLQADEII